MFVRYDVDVDRVPDSVLLIPFLGTIVPIAWVLEATLSVPVVEASFWEALPAVQQSFQRLYPAVPWAGQMHAETVEEGGAEPGGRSALLFSGGVDSVASFVNHESERPLLVSVWGADIGLHQSRDWQRVAAANRVFAHEHGLDIAFITTNFRTFFNHDELRSRFLPSFPNWYSGIQQGLGLATLCAPLSHTHQVRRLLIPSTHTSDWNRPWGSHPTIENLVRWETTAVRHDGDHLTRQMKLRLLAEYIRNREPRLRLRVCWGRGENCSSCVKCCLTMIGLLLEGLDPAEHGFRFDAGTLRDIRRQLEGGRMPLSETAAWMWVDLQRNISNRTRIDVPGLDDFLTWLAGTSIRDCGEKNRARIRSRIRHYLETRGEPAGRWIRRALRHPFP
jgi:hypothetical protein